MIAVPIQISDIVALELKPVDDPGFGFLLFLLVCFQIIRFGILED